MEVVRRRVVAGRSSGEEEQTEVEGEGRLGFDPSFWFDPVNQLTSYLNLNGRSRFILQMI